MSEGSGSRGCRPVERLSVWPLGTARRWRAAGSPTNSGHEREALGLSQSAVGKACGWSGVKVSYIENAQQKSITDDDLDKLLPRLQVPVRRTPGLLRRRLRHHEQGWWERYGEDVVAGYMDSHRVRAGASLIRTSNPRWSPGSCRLPSTCEEVGAGLVRRGRAVRRSSRSSREAERHHPRDRPAELSRS